MIYLLHFDPPYKHAGHYLGYTEDVDARVRSHLSGRGSPLVRAAVAAGSEVKIVRTWPEGTRTMERALKKQGSSSHLCPLCAPGRLAEIRARRNPDGRVLVRGNDGRFRSAAA